MWEQAQQLFKIYYKFNILIQGIFSKTFEPRFKTSHFFLSLSCQGQWKGWEYPTCVGHYLYYVVGKLLVDSHFLSCWAFLWQALNNYSPKSQESKGKISKICVLGMINWNSEEEKQPFLLLQADNNFNMSCNLPGGNTDETNCQFQPHIHQIQSSLWHLQETNDTFSAVYKWDSFAGCFSPLHFTMANNFLSNINTGL